MRDFFQEQLHQLNRELIGMGAACEEIIALASQSLTDYSADLAKAAQAMVTEAVDAYVKQELTLARKVMDHDDVVDDYFTKVKSGIIEIIVAEPAHGEFALDLLMIAKYFERIGDHCTNIAEWVEFSLTGLHKDWQ